MSRVTSAAWGLGLSLTGLGLRVSGLWLAMGFKSRLWGAF